MSRQRAVHLLILVAICAITYGFGLDRHGVTNWQEAQRLVVAREMQLRLRDEGPRALITPMLHARPYLAKPPIIYWAQIGLAEAMGQRVTLWHLRCVVAIAGTLGVLAAYGCALTLLGSIRPARDEPGRVDEPGEFDERWRCRAALWAALMLATGVLYVRSSRIGELDILLVPSVVAGVWAIAAAWRAHETRRITAFGPVIIACVACAVASMTKGPPGVMVIVVAAYLGMGAWYANHTGTADVSLIRSRGRGEMRTLPLVSGRWRVINGASLAVVYLIGVIAGVDWLADRTAPARDGPRLSDAPSVMLGAAGWFAAGWCFAGLLQLGKGQRGARAKAWVVAISRTHPVGVLVSGLATVAAWGYLAASGANGAVLSGAEEAEDNLRFFVAAAPMKNAEAMLYGVGLGSWAMIACIIWFLKERVRLRPGWMIAVAWAVLPPLVLSVAGKGVARYLTPAWPGVAMVGAIWLSTLIGRSRRPRLVTAVLAVIVGAMSLAQAWWYGFERESRYGERSPRDFMRELLAAEPRVTPADLVCFEFFTPAIEYYAGVETARREPDENDADDRAADPGRWHADPRIVAVGEIGMRSAMSGGDAMSFENFVAEIYTTGQPRAVLMRRGSGGVHGAPAGRDATDPAHRLRAAGLVVEPIDLAARFRIDGGRTDIVAAWVRRPDSR